MADGYILIPDKILARTDLNLSHKVILGVLARLQGQKACCYPSFDYIARACAMSRRQVIAVINDLAARKEITRLHHTHQANTYSVPWVTARNLRAMWAERRKQA